MAAQSMPSRRAMLGALAALPLAGAVSAATAPAQAATDARQWRTCVARWRAAQEAFASACRDHSAAEEAYFAERAPETRAPTHRTYATQQRMQARDIKAAKAIVRTPAPDIDGIILKLQVNDEYEMGMLRQIVADLRRISGRA